jgi:hypothetical protein
MTPEPRYKKIDAVLDFIPMDNANYEFGAKSESNAILRQATLVVHRIDTDGYKPIYCLCDENHVIDSIRIIRGIIDGSIDTEEEHGFKAHFDMHRNSDGLQTKPYRGPTFIDDPDVWLNLKTKFYSVAENSPFYWSMRQVAINDILQELKTVY